MEPIVYSIVYGNHVTDMQHNDGLNLRRNWGEKSCHHKHLVAEFFDETPTGDYLCKDCGKVFEAWEVNPSQRTDEDEE